MPTVNLTPEVKSAFFDLMNRLSPENLSCDGEISRAEQRRRLAQIRRQWAALEARAGGKVSEETVEALWLAHHRAEEATRKATRATIAPPADAVLGCVPGSRAAVKRDSNVVVLTLWTGRPGERPAGIALTPSEARRLAQALLDVAGQD